MDRASLSDAKRVGARLLGDHEERAVALDLFTDAVLGAAAAAPGSWVVTLFPRAIRISVGRLLVLELLEETLWLVVLDDAPGVADLARWRLDDKGFVVLPNPHHSLQIPGKELPGLATELRAAFAPTMAAAAATAGRSSYRNAWAPGAFQMLEEHSGRELPVPSWLGELEASRWWLAPWPSAGLPALAGDGPRPGDAVFLGDAARPLLLDETRIIRIRDGGIDLTPPVVRDAAVPIREKVTGWRQLSVEDLERLGMVSPSDALPTVRFDFEASEVARVIEATRTPSLSRIDLARWRSAFTSRFGQDRLRATDGVDLLELLHGRPSHDSLVYWLEFKEDEQFSNSSFGSIRGGSALKFGLFQRAETQDWVTGSSSAMTALSEAEAVDHARRQRDEILAADAVLASP